jgi:hypothetical protein
MSLNKKDSIDEINKIITEFHSTIFRILKICKKIEPNNIELESLHNKLSLVRDIDPLLIITRCKDKVWMYREYILNENEDFFLNNKFSEFVKEDENKSFMYSLINLIKMRYKEMSSSEKKIIWQLIKDLLKSITAYKKVTNDFLQK